MSNLLSFCLLFGRSMSGFARFTGEMLLSRGRCQPQASRSCTALGPASPSPDISILVKGKCIRKGVFRYGCTRGAQRSCQDLRAELYLTWSYTQPPWSPFPSRSWHRTPTQFILDLSVPAHFPISSFCIFFFFLLPLLQN